MLENIVVGFVKNPQKYIDAGTKVASAGLEKALVAKELIEKNEKVRERAERATGAFKAFAKAWKKSEEDSPEQQ